MRGPSRGKIAFYTMFVGAFALVISQSMMINALASILEEFSIGAELGQLITTGYIFALGLFSATTAMLVNRFSTKRLALFSFCAFIAGCLLCIFADSFPVLVAGRLLQAAGAGISLPLVQDIALAIYPEEQYGKAMGAIGLIVGFAPAIGPAIAGPIIDLAGWRMIFIALAAIVLAVAVLALIFVRDFSEHSVAHFNLRSSVLYFGGFTLLFAGVMRLEATLAPSPLALAELAGGIAILFLYRASERRSREPLLHLESFRSRRFSTDAVLVVFAQASMMIASIMVPLYLQGVQHVNATVSGLTILPGAIILGVLNPWTGRLYDRHGARPVALAGCFLLLVGTAGFALFRPDSSLLLVIGIYGLRSVGISLLWMPLVADASKALGPGERSQATAITTSMRQLFSALLATVFVTIMAVTSGNETGVSQDGFIVSMLSLTAFSFCMAFFAYVTVGREPTIPASRQR